MTPGIRLTGHKDSSVVVCEVGCKAVRSFHEYLYLLARLRNLHEALGEAIADIHQEHKLVPVRRILAKRLRVLSLDTRDRERVRLRREARHGRHDEVRSLRGAPVEVRGARDAHAQEVRREQLDGRVEVCALAGPREVEVVREEHAHDADEPVQRPDEERRPDVCPEPLRVGVEVAADQEHAVGRVRTERMWRRCCMWAYPIMKKCVMKKNSYAFCRTGRIDRRTRIVRAIMAANPQGMNHDG